MGALITFPAPVAGDPSNCIYGYVTASDTGDPIADLELQVQNLRTSECIYVTTGENGYYLAHLDDFSEWAEEDYIWIQSGYLAGYAICDPILYLSPIASPNYAYQFNLIGTPLTGGNEGGFYPIDLASMHMTNNEITQSGVQWGQGIYNEKEFIISDEYNGVDIIVSPCYFDDGTNDVAQNCDMTVIYTFTLLYRKHYQENEWHSQDTSTVTGSYTVHWHTIESGNPKNLYVHLSKDEAKNHYWDFCAFMSCDDDGVDWDTDHTYKVEQITFKFE